VWVLTKREEKSSGEKPIKSTFAEYILLNLKRQRDNGKKNKFARDEEVFFFDDVL
jgi:hypothetical protein